MRIKYIQVLEPPTLVLQSVVYLEKIYKVVPISIIPSVEPVVVVLTIPELGKIEVSLEATQEDTEVVNFISVKYLKGETTVDFMINFPK